MDTLNLPYKTKFAAQIRSVEPTEQTLNEAKASLTDLKALLPADINPEDDPQLLYICANLYVAGMVNLNDDGVDIETSLAKYKGFEKQQLNIEHDRNRVAGYVLHAGLSEFGTDRLITEDEARAGGKPFNVAVVAALWKVNNKELCSYLAEASSPLHPDYNKLSLSFEVGFSSYNIGVIDAATRVISEAKKVITPADADYEEMSKRLRCFGGSGKLGVDSTEGVYQILAGTFIPLGGGIVTMPAAAVKGIVAITEGPDIEPDGDEDDARAKEAELAQSQRVVVTDLRTRLMDLLTIFDKCSLSRITLPKTRVLPITSQPITNMKSLQEIKEKMASAEKPEDLKQIVASVTEIAEALSAASEKLSLELEQEKNRGKQIEAARAEAQLANDTLKKDFDELKVKLDGIEAHTKQVEAEQAFQARMAAIEEEFEFTDDERSEVVSEIKPLNNDGFTAWMTKAKKMMKEKTKTFKKFQKDDKQKKVDDMKAALAAKGFTVTINEDNLIQEVIASAKANEVSEPISNITQTAKSLKERVEEEFLENVTIGGKKLSTLNKK